MAHQRMVLQSGCCRASLCPSAFLSCCLSLLLYWSLWFEVVCIEEQEIRSWQAESSISRSCLSLAASTYCRGDDLSALKVVMRKQAPGKAAFIIFSKRCCRPPSVTGNRTYIFHLPAFVVALSYIYLVLWMPQQCAMWKAVLWWKWKTVQWK